MNLWLKTNNDKNTNVNLLNQTLIDKVFTSTVTFICGRKHIPSIPLGTALQSFDWAFLSRGIEFEVSRCLNLRLFQSMVFAQTLLNLSLVSNIFLWKKCNCYISILDMTHSELLICKLKKFMSLSYSWTKSEKYFWNINIT